MKEHKLTIHIFSLAVEGVGISGGDKIFIEFARNWKNTENVIIHTWDAGVQMMDKQGLSEGKSLNIINYNATRISKFGKIPFYIFRIILGAFKACLLRTENSKYTVFYSSSEFLIDVVPTLILKFRYPKSIWVASWYQTAPNPLVGFGDSSRDQKHRFKALLYWLSQIPTRPLISLFSNFVLVNNNDEMNEFPKHNKLKKVGVVLGAVDISKIEIWKNKLTSQAKYKAVFQGRFHPQKGVSELIDIWKLVVNQIPSAKLVMIGDGPEMQTVIKKIEKYHLEKNIELKGYLFDGEEKYQIFVNSEIVVHPSYFDSGGMASAEAAAFGLPIVGFNLPAYKYYYPKGMLKVPIGNKTAFAKAVIYLLVNSKERRKIGKEAMLSIHKNFDWKVRAKETLNLIKR